MTPGRHNQAERGHSKALDEGMNEAGCDLSGPGRQRMEHHHASTRHSFIEETVSPDWQSPHPVTRKVIVTATAEVDGVTRKRLWTAYVRPSPG